MKQKNVILLISILIPVVIAILINLPTRPDATFNIQTLPFLHAIINASTSVVLLISLYAIKNKNISLHKSMNISATILSNLFLVSYVVYHIFATSTKYGDYNHDGLLDESEKIMAGSLRYIYYLILITHILFATIVIPFVLYSLMYAFDKQFEKHKKLSKYTWSIWFYVSVTGVLVYVMIKNFY